MEHGFDLLGISSVSFLVHVGGDGGKKKIKLFFCPASCTLLCQVCRSHMSESCSYKHKRGVKGDAVQSARR